MTVLRLLLLILLLALSVRAQQPFGPPAFCPITGPPANRFAPPSRYRLEEDTQGFWLGTDKLFTVLRKSGVWYWSPHPRGHENEVQPLTEKTFWGSVDFDWKTEYPPKIKVTGRRLDGSTPPILTSRPTNAFPGPAAAMLVGVYIPTPGCWELTAEYKGQKLSFVIWLQPLKPSKP